VTDITELLGKARGGDRAASDALFAALYQELRRLAAGQLRGEDAQRATSLVHEAYEKLVRHGGIAVNDREHFFAVAARTMRQIVIDHVRARNAQRRGGGEIVVAIETTAMEAAAHGRDDEVLALDDALRRLADVDPALARLVELRFYAGLELAEIASIGERSERSLKRDWRRARAFLYRELDPGTAHVAGH
jgi:RNA polymerase sigma factor (TIGR02999 family)